MIAFETEIALKSPLYSLVIEFYSGLFFLPFLFSLVMGVQNLHSNYSQSSLLMSFKIDVIEIHDYEAVLCDMQLHVSLIWTYKFYKFLTDFILREE